MKNILIVEDKISCKLPTPVLEVIRNMCNIEIRNCMSLALECMKEGNISGIILDLGFCSNDTENDYEEKMGLRFLKELLNNGINVPSVLIYSSTFLEQEEISEFEVIRGVMEFLDLRVISEFITNC